MKKLKILHLEDLQSDADIVRRTLQKSDLNPEILLVDNKIEFVKGLRQFAPDVIISDHSLPSFDSLEALNFVQDSDLRIPFILLTSTMSEEFAVQVIKQGADDYLLKDRIERLPSAIMNALKKHEAEKERKKILDKVIENENLLKETERLAHIGSWQADLGTGKTHWSDGTYAIYGYEPQEVVLSFDLVLKHFHPDDLESEKARIERTLQELPSSESHVRIIDRYGECKHLHSELVVERNERGQPVKLRGFIQDITELKEAEEALRQSEQHYRYLFHNNPLPMWVIDKETFKFLDVNNAATNHYGYGRAEMLGMTATAIRPQEDVERFVGLSRPDFGNLQNAGIWRHVKKDGTIIEVDLSVSDISYEGRLARLVLINDVTEKLKSEAEKKKAEEAIIALNQSLERKVNERTKELQDANRELETFSYSVSHDLQSPLRSLKGFSQILVKNYSDKLDEQGIEFLNFIDSSAMRMEALIRDLLAFSKLGKAGVHQKQVNMKELVQQVVDEVNGDTPNFRAETRVGELKACICDPILMKQVWINLIGNAVKYSSKKDSPMVEIGMDTADGEPVYFVKDNGAGFDMKHADRMFGVFQRLHEAKEFEGTGVGLATVQRIIEKHGGRIWAEGKVNEGATFSFTLPHRNGMSHG
jgi:PAS domain S-box-containing protein